MGEARLHSVLTLLESSRSKYEEKCRMQLSCLEDSLNSFTSILKLPPSNTTYVVEACDTVELPVPVKALPDPKFSARVTRSRAKRTEGSLPVEEGPPMKRIKVQKVKSNDDVQLLATLVPNPVAEIPKTPGFVQKHRVEKNENVHHTPGSGQMLRVENTDNLGHTPVFGQGPRVENSDELQVPKRFPAEEQGDSPSLHLVQSKKELERLNSCLTSVNDRSHGCGFEFQLSLSGPMVETTPGLEPQKSVSNLRSLHVENHSFTPRTTRGEAEEEDKENRNPNGFWNITAKKALTAGKLLVSSACKVLSESRRGNQMAHPAQEHGMVFEVGPTDANPSGTGDYPVLRPSKGLQGHKEAASPKRARRQLALGRLNKEVEQSEASPELAAELADPDNITSSITKRASPVEKTLLEVRLIMHKDKALILESQKRIASTTEDEEMPIRLTQTERVSTTTSENSENLESDGEETELDGIPTDCILSTDLPKAFSLQDAHTPQFIGKGAFSNTITPVSEGSVCTLSVDSEFLNIHTVAPASVTSEALETAKLCAIGSTTVVKMQAVTAVFAGPTSYDISPYKDTSDEEEDENVDRPQKPIPSWARKEKLMLELNRLQYMDPDAIFTTEKSCSLNEVFGTEGSKKRSNFARRGSSGNWLKDQLTWEEELDYKLSMGYINREDCKV